MSLVALLWQAIAAHTLGRPRDAALIDYGDQLHDSFFPAFGPVDRPANGAGRPARGRYPLPEDAFLPFWQWRFPLVLEGTLTEGMILEVRQACEGWPLLSETPSEGGTTSRFVDTSIERLEFTAPAVFSREYRVFANGRELRLTPLPTVKGQPDRVGCGLRYRRTALFPSLHPGIKPQLPLEVAVTASTGKKVVAGLSPRRRRAEVAAGHRSRSGSSPHPAQAGGEVQSRAVDLRFTSGLRKRSGRVWRVGSTLRESV